MSGKTFLFHSDLKPLIILTNKYHFMKKLLLSIFSIFVGITAFALDNPAEVIFKNLPDSWPTSQKNAADFSDVVVNGVTFNFVKSCRNGSNLLVAGKNNPGAASFDFKIDGTAVTKVELTTPGGSLQLAASAPVAMYVNNTLVENQNWDNTNGKTWTYSIPEDKQAVDGVVKFVVGTSATKANATIASMKIYYTSSGPTKESAGLAYATTSYDVKAGTEFATPVLTNPHNLPVTYTSSTPTVATVDATGKVDILTAGTTTITAKSEATDVYYEGTASYTLNVIDASKYAANIAAFVAGAPNKNDEMIMENDVTVVYANGANVYIRDNSGSTLIYKYDLGYNTGDIIPGGWKAKASPFNGLYEIVPVGNMPAASNNEEVTYPDMTTVPVEDDVNKVVVLKNVTFSVATPAGKSDFTGKMGGSDVAFYNNFSVASQPVAIYDVTAAISYRSNKVTVYPISYVKVGDAQGAETKNYTSIDAFIKEKYNGPSVITTPMTVIYQNGRNLYVKDSSNGYLLIYNQDDLASIKDQFKNGDVIASVSGTYKSQNGLPEMIPTAVGNKTEGTPVEPETPGLDELSDNMLSQYVKFENVKITGTGNPYTITDADNQTVQMYNSFTNSNYYNPIVKVITGDNMGVVGFVSINGETLQITPIEVYDMESNAIDGIGADNEDAPVEYFNIQGVRVNADRLVPGLYIVRQGSKASKIIVK